MGGGMAPQEVRHCSRYGSLTLRHHCACGNQGVRCQPAAVEGSCTVPPRQQRQHTQNNPTDLVLSRYQALQKRYPSHQSGLVCIRRSEPSDRELLPNGTRRLTARPLAQVHHAAPHRPVVSRAEFGAVRTTSARTVFTFNRRRTVI